MERTNWSDETTNIWRINSTCCFIISVKLRADLHRRQGEWKWKIRPDKIHKIRREAISFHSTCVWGLCIICINYIHVGNRWKRKSWWHFSTNLWYKIKIRTVKLSASEEKYRTVYVVINTKLFRILNSTVQLSIVHSYEKYVIFCRAVVFSLGYAKTC